MKLIKLKNSNLTIMVDNEDYEYLKQYNWHLINGYARAYIHQPIGKNMYMHRLITGYKKNIHTDHIDNNRLNNQKHNLRKANASNNQQNSLKSRSYAGRPTSSQYKGVCWHKRDKVWQSYIKPSKNRPMKFIGSYHDEKDAADSYNMEAIKYFGKFAHLNDLTSVMK